jgi:DNA-binding beta-propeller fold protein YncE
VAHPQIAMFARLADGGQAPARVIYGQASKLSRTMHDVRYNETHDEIVVPVPYAQAIITFRGAATEQEAPIRIIQGQKTGEIGSRLDVDPVHNEIFTYTSRTIRVYPRDANGDVGPVRIFEGPDTQLKNVYGIAVDPVNNLLFVGLNSGWGTEESELSPEQREKGAILVFNRTDSGNTKPRNVIRGERSGIIRINQMQVNPQRKLIIVAMPGIRDHMEPEGAFVGAWNYDDNGDVPPVLKIPIGERTKLKKPFGVVLNPKHKELIVSDMRNQGILVFSVPEMF